MITKTAILAAISVAQEFDNKRIFLSAKAGTPLANLNELSSLATFATPVDDNEYNPDVNMIENNSGFKQDDNQKSLHTEGLEAMVSEISLAVQSHLNFARNTVKPLIQELYDEIKKCSDNIQISNVFNPIIEIYDLPEPMMNIGFEEDILNFKDINYVNNPKSIGLNTMTGPEVMKFITTGDDNFNKELEIWAAKKGDYFFEQVWLSVFTKEQGSISFESLTNPSGPNGLDASIAVYLIARRLFDNPPEGTAMTLFEYNSQIAEIRNQAVSRIQNAYSEYNSFKTTKLIIKGFSADNKVVVLGYNYRPWLEEGNNNAVIFGSILSSNVGKFATDLLEKKQEYITNWERQNAILTLTNKNRYFNELKSVIASCTKTLVINNMNKCFAHLNTAIEPNINLPEYMEYEKKLAEFTENVKECDTADIWRLSKDIVCKCLFYYTDADKILCGIDNACKANPNMEIREAALISTIIYVVDYVCDQMQTSGV